MPTFEPGTVVRVPFPYTDRNARQHRPALVVSRRGLGDQKAFLWVVMITSARNRRWPGDVPIEEGHLEVGLPAPSLIRTTKIATMEARHADRIGALSGSLKEEVASAVRSHLV